MAPRRTIISWIGLYAGGLYFLCATLGIATRSDMGVACLWPATAWLLALLTVRPRRDWPTILAGCAVANMVATIMFGLGPIAAIPMAVANMAEGWAAAWLLDRFRARRGTLDSLGRLGWFVLAAGGIGPAIGASIAAGVSTGINGLPYGDQWMRWFVGHGLSTIALTPVLSLLVSGGIRRWISDTMPRQRVEAAALLTVTAGVTGAVFSQSIAPLLFVPILPVMLTTFRVGRIGAAVAVMIVAIIGCCATLNGIGPAMMVGGVIAEPIQFLQLYLACTALTAFPVAADLNRRRTLYRQLRDSEARYRLLADNSTDIVLSIDLSGRIGYISPSAAQLLGYAPAALTGRKVLRLVHAVDRDLILHAHRDALASPTGTQIVEYRSRTAHGGLRWFEAHTRAVIDEDRHVTGVVAVVRDVSHRKSLEAELSRAAATDSLTGLPNRRAFDAALAARMVGTATGDGIAGCVAVFDLDHFKRVNDRFGHGVGDHALQAFARITRGVIRDEDMVARLGGEEFGILMPGATVEQAHHICERVRATIAATKLREGTLTVELTVSAGIASIDPATGAAAVMHAADLALYRAKADGRDRLRLAA